MTYKFLNSKQSKIRWTDNERFVIVDISIFYNKGSQKYIARLVIDFKYIKDYTFSAINNDNDKLDLSFEYGDIEILECSTREQKLICENKLKAKIQLLEYRKQFAKEPDSVSEMFNSKWVEQE